MDSSNNKLVMQRIVPGERESPVTINLGDLSMDLLELHQEMQPAMDEWGTLTQARISETILRMFSVGDIGFLLHLHGGKGVLLGAVMAMCAVEDTIQPEIDVLDQDTVSEEELEELVSEGVLGFGRDENEGSNGS